MSDPQVKRQVRQFYDQIGWQMAGEGLYQNARYEDLRPVSREYIHRCHMRVKRHLQNKGRFLLDAGSGPVQYPEYLTYSEGYAYRLCVDISIVALKEARKRLGEHGLFVVADVANLPFKAEVFDGIVSLHTLHHLPLNEQKKAYAEIYRALQPGSTAVVVNGWTDSPLMRRSQWLVRLMEWFGQRVVKLRRKSEQVDHDAALRCGRQPDSGSLKKAGHSEKGDDSSNSTNDSTPTGTFVEKLDAAWLRRELAGHDLKILVWRSVSVRFLRAVIHKASGGKYLLRLLFALEEKFPRYFGEKGQYPLVVLRKPLL